MLSRDEAIAIALKLAAETSWARPIESVGDVFTRDCGQTWTVHLVPEPVVIDDRWIAVDTPGVMIVCVNSENGRGRWVETL